jgi:hypothetical protein
MIRLGRMDVPALMRPPTGSLEADHEIPVAMATLRE